MSNAFGNKGRVGLSPVGTVEMYLTRGWARGMICRRWVFCGHAVKFLTLKIKILPSQTSKITETLARVQAEDNQSFHLCFRHVQHTFQLC